ncbi:MAG TPA: helix-turn-helix domain-containing protein [Actinomycetota bacterium]|nr:helix-turn-helix domain-containing protein [Actinomycetota bacterium]
MPSAERRPAGRGEEIVELLRGINASLRGQLAQDSIRLGLPKFSRRLPILMRVCDEPGITVNELARAIGMPKSQVSVLVAEMEAEGVVRKTGDPNDLRRIRLSPTAEGRRRAQAWRRAYRAVVLEALRPMADDDVAHLHHGLMALREALEPESADEAREGAM